ncbi:hypothetical protein A4H34_02665 [Peptidiphaga gingivicola]|uniref:Histidine kinase/HSP90-like ATPase domain-containing protein n=1 Tax=Peptidiphaga gingivicola TaxID=2741497 RepID=A0A179B319_9ACTO|nr:sensor histidine kinase [Peptidiphaga gingivicola]OAP86097.1 hypothetical protein A4H34_02665 [Peptidiphaga gingivicola]
MKREWTLYFAASTVLLALYIASRFALDRGAAGEGARVNLLAVVAACTLVSVPTLLFATLASRSWRYGPVVGSRGGWAFAAVTVVSVWGAALADRNALLAQIYAIPELFIALAYRRALAAAAVMNFGLVAVQALGGEPTPDNLSKWAVAAVATVVLTGLFGKPIDLLAETNMRNQELVEQLQARNAQIARLSHLEGTARERERIAREMHDTIAQGLASILALARAAAAEVAQAGGAGANRQASRHLAMIVELAQEGLDDTRRMIADASPRALDGRGLAEAVGRAADRLEREGIAVARSLDSTLPPLPQPARVAILRIAQEAIANVARHSRAANVAVSLRSVAGVAVLEVRDDGVGFDPATAGAVDAEGGSSSNQATLRSRPESADEGRAGLARVRRVWQRGRLGRAPEGDDSGFGIPDMRGRAADLGGSVSIDSSPGRGTRVLARIPVEAPAVEDAASAEGPTSRETASQALQEPADSASQEAADSALQGKEKE